MKMKAPDGTFIEVANLQEAEAVQALYFPIFREAHAKLGGPLLDAMEVRDELFPIIENHNYNVGIVNTMNEKENNLLLKQSLAEFLNKSGQELSDEPEDY